jgi:AcrR family transcriptional regulator
MLGAAYRLFCEHGYASTTMSAIAELAEVAVQTLYFTFHTKGAILSEVLGAAVVGFERWLGPPPGGIDTGDPAALGKALAWFDGFVSEPDARQALELFVTGGLEPLRRTAPLLAALHAAVSDPDVRAVVELGEQRRVASFAAAIKLLAKKRGGLRTGLSSTRATDILVVVFSEATVNALRARGWSDAECKRWFVDALSRELLAKP